MKKYLIVFGTFLLIDGVWLIFIAPDFYSKYLGYLLGETKILPAIIFYLVYCFGILFFAVNPSLQKNSLRSSITKGGLLGLVAYSAYDLTNLAVIKDWPFIVTIVDLIWGTLLSAAVSVVSFLIIKKLNHKKVN